MWCPVSPELCLSKEKGREKRNNTSDVVNPDPKTERTRQKTRPDMKKMFLKHFRGEIARKYAKTIGKSLSKTKGPQKNKKQKFAPEKLSQKPALRRRELCQKTAKDKNQTVKNTKQKNGQHFPLQQGEEQAKKLCDSTCPTPSERICVTIRLPPPFPLPAPTLGDSGRKWGEH